MTLDWRNLADPSICKKSVVISIKKIPIDPRLLAKMPEKANNNIEGLYKKTANNKVAIRWIWCKSSEIAESEK